MKRSYIHSVALLLLLVSCSQDQVLNLQHDTPIAFRLVMDRQTKAVSNTASNLLTFNVTAWKEGGSVPYIDHDDFDRGSDDSFTSAGNYYWPSTGTITFYAYAPKATSGNGLTFVDEKTFAVEPLADTDNQIDLVFAKNSGNKADNGASGVELNFRHAMSQIRISVKNSNEAVKFNVTGWKIVGVDGSAVFGFDDSVLNTNTTAQNSQNTISRSLWSDNDDYDTSYSKTDISKNVVFTNGSSELLDGSAILIPQAAPKATAYANTAMNGAYIAIRYDAFNAANDRAIVNSDTWGCWPVDFDWDPGFCYNYVVDLSGFGYKETGTGALVPIMDGTKIKFVDVKVDSWQPEWGVDVNLSTSGSFIKPLNPSYLRFHAGAGKQVLYLDLIEGDENESSNLCYSIDEGQTWSMLRYGDGNGVEFGYDGTDCTDVLVCGKGFYNESFKSGGRLAVFGFSTDASVRCTGNIGSLTDWENPPTTLTKEGQYAFLFRNCKCLFTAPDLPATTLSNSCYYGMFSGCTWLETAPELPATTLKENCYGEMFYNCTNLEAAPDLPAMALVQNCYYGMFYGCSSLKSVKASFVTYPNYYCIYYWLYGVSTTGNFYKNSLATWNRDNVGIPQYWTVSNASSGSSNTPTDSYLRFHCEDNIQALYIENVSGNETDTYLEYSVDEGATWTPMQFKDGDDNYVVFGNYGGNSTDVLVRGLGFYNELTNQNSKQKRFGFVIPGSDHLVDCTGNVGSLTDYTNPTAALMIDGQYYGLFQNCACLRTAPELPATTLSMGCYALMFDGCTNLTDAPQLPATDLSRACYFQMFNGCTSLVTAPDLPATTLTDMCYYQMFAGCSSLSSVKALFTDDQNASSQSSNIYNWLNGVSTTGTFYKNSSAAWDRDDIGIPADWTVTDAQ